MSFFLISHFQSIYESCFSVQVQPNSVAERCGLLAGDAILRINAENTDNLTHENAKMEIVRSGNNIDMLVARYAGDLLDI